MWELPGPIASCSDHICSNCLLLEELRLTVDELEPEIQTLWHIRDGDSYLDTQEVVTLGRLSSTNLVSGQRQQGVTASEAGRGTLYSGTEEPQLLTLSDKYKTLAPCGDEEKGCRDDEPADRDTLVQEAIQAQGAKRQM
eukprot:g23607.t1